MDCTFHNDSYANIKILIYNNILLVFFLIQSKHALM